MGHVFALIAIATWAAILMAWGLRVPGPSGRARWPAARPGRSCAPCLFSLRVLPGPGTGWPHGCSWPAGGLHREAAALAEIEKITRGAHLVGAVVSFDAEVLAARMRAHGISPSFHYHLIDVEALAVGWLAGSEPPPGTAAVEVRRPVSDARRHHQRRGPAHRPWRRKVGDADLRRRDGANRMMAYHDAIGTVPACAGVALVLTEGLCASARRLTRAVRPPLARDPGPRPGPRDAWGLWWAAGRHAGEGRALPAPGPQPLPVGPCAAPRQRYGTMPFTWLDPDYESPAMTGHLAARPTPTYDVRLLLAAADKEAREQLDLEAWWSR